MIHHGNHGDTEILNRHNFKQFSLEIMCVHHGNHGDTEILNRHNFKPFGLKIMCVSTMATISMAILEFSTSTTSTHSVLK
jgi:hypothetical protein